MANAYDEESAGADGEEERSWKNHARLDLKLSLKRNT
jgi:hypothetical protein